VRWGDWENTISRWTASGEKTVSIVRIGLAETKNFSEGYEAIFGKKKKPQAKKPGAGPKNKKKKTSKKKV
jgi:hypothetical protein